MSTPQGQANNSPRAGGNVRAIDLDSIWEDLKEGIRQVYEEKSNNMSKNRYIELYTYVGVLYVLFLFGLKKRILIVF